MFNLLRRTRQRKAQKIASDDEEDTAATTTATATATAAAAATTSRAKAAAESLSESKRESSFSAVQRAQESGSGSAKMASPARRAVIEELEDFASDDDEEKQCVKLAKTAAATASLPAAPSTVAVAAAASNGHSAISSIINNMGEGERGPATRTATKTVVDEHNDRNVAAAVARAGSQNEAAKAKANNADDRLIGSSDCQTDRYKRILVPAAIDGDAQPEGRQQQQEEQQQQQHSGIAGRVIDETVIYRQQSKQSNEQKRLSRLSLGNFALQLGNSNSNSSSNSSSSSGGSSSNSNGNICDSIAAEESRVLKKKRRTLQKSREFLTEIFMARGRNHQRKQQQQQHAGKCKDVIASGQATATATLAVVAAHLETNSDPATVSTNSYQMTMSNNSPQNRHNASVPQSADKERGEHQHTRTRSRSRSNSAGAATRQEQPEQPQQEQDLPNEESRQREDVARQHDASDVFGDFIQAANVELFTRAGDQQGDATLLQQQRSSSSNTSYNSNNNTSDITMGQTSAKPNESSGQSASSSRASTPREFRESVVSESSAPLAPPRQHKQQQQQQQQQEVPRITVSDCSFESSPRSSLGAEEIFYDSGINIEELNEAHVETLEDDVFAVDIPTTIYQQGGRPWTRLTNVKLENVQEEAEDEHEEEEAEQDDAIEAEPEPEDDELDEALEMLDHDRAATPNGSRQSASSERSALKSDSNLSSSYADSGIGLASSVHHDRQHQHSIPQHAPAPPPRSSSHCAATLPQRTPFVRDANSTSTDCDCGEEMLLQCDELDVDDADEQHFDERLVCIESISLPDVVVESTTANATANSTTTTTATTNASSGGTGGGGYGGDGHLNINIANGAGGNSLGNVHFIPIHIEGSGAASARSRSNSPKYRSLDDSCIGRNSVEIVEDGSVLNTPSPTPTRDIPNRGEAQELKKELREQKARFGAQLEDAHNNVRNLEAKVGDMQVKIQNLEQELSLKQWNVDRLQGELVAAQKDDEYVRKKLKLLEDEKIHLRHKYSDDEDEFRRKYDALEAQYNELTEKYKQTQTLASNLQAQLASARLEVEDWKNEVNKIRAELEEQIRVLKSALEYSEAERKICEDKWQKEFEMLRTHNREREDTLMSDCEWQMRQMQRQCKDKLDKSNYERKQAAAKAEELELELQSRRKEAEQLRICQAQVKSLGGVVSEQERSIQTLMERIENLKGELEMANENLETQIEAVRKIKYQCDNAIYDKERQMIYRIDEVRNEAAAFWENKLYTEMTRLTNELESVYVEERRDALDKLQAEHIEELRALTNRYTANEEELRQEIDELTLNLELKKGDFLELRERSDNALLQTRMHLDRADREYQNAMCREEDRRVELEANLKKEFEAEKQEMEEKFRERLGQVKEEFAKELQLSTQDMVETHRKELEAQKAKLQAEKDQALQEIVERHRAKMAAAEERMNDVELRHQRNLKDLKAAYDAEKAALDKRDISNANEIEQLHRKCRCLTNLFEEMRMRYERRDPRPEDLREISELRTRCDSQERDLFVLTDRLREMQIQMSELQQNGNATTQRNGSSAASKKPPSKTIATSCDVIYEERETPEHDDDDDDDEEEEREEEDSASSEPAQNGQEEEQGEQEPSDTESNHTIEVNGKCSDRINEDDAHMISAV